MGAVHTAHQAGQRTAWLGVAWLGRQNAPASLQELPTICFRLFFFFFLGRVCLCVGALVASPFCVL